LHIPYELDQCINQQCLGNPKPKSNSTRHLLVLDLNLALKGEFLIGKGCLMLMQKARAGIKEVHFLPFSPSNRRTAITYIDYEGKMRRISKGAPEQVKLCKNLKAS